LGAPYEEPIDVIVPAHNEERVIVYTIKSLLQSEGVNLRIIAVDDGSTDGTLEVLRREFANEPKVRVVTQKNGGKASALNHGLRLSDAEVVVTLDADTIFTHDCIKNLVHPFVDPTVTAVAGNAKVGNRINILTRWQALEYIMSQNFVRRANSLINCITVVPGAVGAWRRDVLLKVGGYHPDTLAEDGEITIRVLEAGGRIVYADGAVAWTEAPQNLRNLFRQRFRWMYGTFQTAWKHRKITFRHPRKLLSWVAMPNLFLFQIIYPFAAPLMDLVMFLCLFFYIAQRAYHPSDVSTDQLMHVAFFYSVFLVFDLATALISISLEPKREDYRLLVWLPWQRLFYRQLSHVIAIKSMFKAMRGEAVGWGHITRNATHLQYFTESELAEEDAKTVQQVISESEDLGGK
jgi:cellulose synthase/poly-beta-1,6-N-acetylglucosamine synthase-like glycosyltransferase